MSINSVNFRNLLISIVLICFSSFFFAIHDTLLKFISQNNLSWYHHVSIGGPFGFITLIILMFFSGGVKKNIILQSYKIPILRGILSLPTIFMAFVALKYIPLSIFTTLILTLPFFLVIFSQVILNEQVAKKTIYSLIIGFIGVIIILRPGIEKFNFYIFFPIVMSAISGINMILVNKYRNVASPYSFAFYNLLIPYLFALFFFLYDPFVPNLIFIFLIGITWVNGILGMFLITFAYYRSTNFSNRIAPYIYTQLLWAVMFGYIFYKEIIDFYTLVGSFLIITCGTIILRTRNN